MSAACSRETITLRELLRELGHGDHAFLTLVAAVCFMHPFPMPGISHALALIIIIVGLRLTRGQPLWLPSRLVNTPFRSRVIGRVLGAAAALLRRTDWLIRPRARWMTSHRFSAQANGAAMILCGALIMIPLPPPTNFPPASALLLISLGILEADGLLLGLGYAAATITTAAFVALCAVSWTAVKSFI